MTSDRCCPTCGRALDPEPDISIEALTKWCRENNHIIFPGDRVDETTAAVLLGKSPGTLRNWRAQDRPLPYSRTGNGRGRIYYLLSDLVTFMGRVDEN
jgi:hypothetical protein